MTTQPIKRFDVDAEGRIDYMHDGPFVRYKEVASLEARLERAEAVCRATAPFLIDFHKLTRDDMIALQSAVTGWVKGRKGLASGAGENK